ncbi:MAG: heavy-metal-associated domain-containing protein [Gemmatimonadetes bacterium]|nr:heavy-metal-associated domain-containing protein [Gemmatimonadota bacterium]
MERVKLEIKGITCEHCARTIRNHLSKEEGVKQVEIDWRTGQAEILFDPDVTHETKILANPVFSRHYSARLASQP